MKKPGRDKKARDDWKDWIQSYRTLLRVVGEDADRPGLKHTPERAAHALQYLTGGYAESIDSVVNDALFPSSSEEMVVVKNIELYSLCEHHLLPFFGTCHIAYLPQGQILGLSKFARIVDIYARRLQVQEELTRQIADGILSITNALGVGVIVEAQHLCMMMRGVENSTP
ncbi:GTP cyclohydrolase I, partial [mine drainage metagenome]